MKKKAKRSATSKAASAMAQARWKKMNTAARREYALKLVAARRKKRENQT